MKPTVPPIATPLTTAPDSAALWAAFHQPLYAFVRRRVATDEDAEDVLQGVFARIHSAQPTTPIQSVSGWVYEITRNALADHHRQRARQQRLAEGLENEPSRSSADLAGGGGDPAGDDPGNDPASELSCCLQPLIDQLAPRYAEAIRLTDLGELSQAAAARQLGLSASGMKSRVQRGRAQLKALLLDCCQITLDARNGIADVQGTHGVHR